MDCNDILTEMTKNVLECGGKNNVEKQHSRGKNTARERIDMLLDEGSFFELNRFAKHHCTDFNMDRTEVPADGVITGFGTVGGRTVLVYAQDYTSLGGSLGKMHAEKICKCFDLAAENGCPIIGMNDSGGARIQEGVDALSGYGKIFYKNSICSGKIPQISLIMGPCAGGAAYSPALSDVVIMTEDNGKMFITGPRVIESITGEQVSAENLGGAHIHASISGVSHLTATNDREAIDYAKCLLSYLPSSNANKPPRQFYKKMDERREELDGIIPENQRKPYNMKEVIKLLVDDNSLFELSPDYADNIIIGFARIAGISVGVIANQPESLGGCLDINSANKAARFINFCDAFNVPLINLVDVPGFIPGIEQEHGGIIRHGAKMLYAYSVAEVPKITVILRKAYGGSYMAMCSKEMGADIVYAWPKAEIAVMGAEGAVNILYKEEIESTENPEALKREIIREYEAKFSNPYFAASRGYVDSIIRPSDTRIELIKALSLLEGKTRTSHRGNIPL